MRVLGRYSARYFFSAHDFNGTIAAWHGKHINDFGSCRQLTASAFACVLRGATDGGWWSAGRWFQTAGKASMTPHADDDEMGTNRHWYSVYFHVQLQIPVTAMISCAP